MKVAFKLFASLADHLPPGRTGNVVELDLDAGTTVLALMTRFGVPPQCAHLVLVNGVYVAPAARAAHALADGDELAIWPPVAGG